MTGNALYPGLSSQLLKPTAFTLCSTESDSCASRCRSYRSKVHQTEGTFQKPTFISFQDLGRGLYIHSWGQIDCI